MSVWWKLYSENTDPGLPELSRKQSFKTCQVLLWKTFWCIRLNSNADEFKTDKKIKAKKNVTCSIWNAKLHTHIHIVSDIVILILSLLRLCKLTTHTKKTCTQFSCLKMCLYSKIQWKCERKKFSFSCSGNTQ